MRKNRKNRKNPKTFTERVPQIAVILVLIGGIGMIAWNLFSPGDSNAVVRVKVPELSALAEQGRQAFEKNCAQCHGVNGAGTDKGPLFVHSIYNPGHHADVAFFYAARRGVRQHHWPFGDMPAQPQVSDEEIALIVRYIREMQEANGITYQPHQM